MREKLILEIVTASSASGTGGQTTQNNESSSSSKSSSETKTSVGGILTMVTQLAFIGKIGYDMLQIFKPVFSIMTLIGKLLGQFLQPIAQIMVLLLRPILILLRPILNTYKTMMRPFQDIITRAGGDIAILAGRGDTGSAIAVTGVMLGTLIKSSFFILANTFGKLLAGAVALVIKGLATLIIGALTFLLLPVTMALDFVLDILKGIAQILLQIGKWIIQLIPKFMMGKEKKESAIGWIDTMQKSDFMNDPLSISNAMLGASFNLIGDIDKSITEGVESWKDTMDTTLTANLDKLAITQGEKLAALETQFGIRTSDAITTLTTDQGQKLTDLETDFGIGLTNAVTKPVSKLVTELNAITAKINSPNYNNGGGNAGGSNTALQDTIIGPVLGAYIQNQRNLGNGSNWSNSLAPIGTYD
jgi:hypothetical protein